MSLPKPSELTGQAREAFDTYRRIGVSEQQAVRQVVADGLVELSSHDRLAQVFEAMGLSPRAAEVAAVGRDGGRALLSEAALTDAEWERRVFARLDEMDRKITELRERH